jgi:hypothetical protein
MICSAIAPYQIYKCASELHSAYLGQRQWQQHAGRHSPAQQTPPELGLPPQAEGQHYHSQQQQVQPPGQTTAQQIGYSLLQALLLLQCWQQLQVLLSLRAHQRLHQALCWVWTPN